MQAVVDLAIGSLLPEKCNKWISSTQKIRETFLQEQKEKKDAVVRDLSSNKASMQRALREAVVNHVSGIFSYVLAFNPSLIKFTRRFPDIGLWIAMT